MVIELIEEKCSHAADKVRSGRGGDDSREGIDQAEEEHQRDVKKALASQVGEFKNNLRMQKIEDLLFNENK